MRILSVDIGVHNMAFYIEEFDEGKVSALQERCKTIRRYTPDKSSTSEWRQLLDQVYINGKTIHIDRVDLYPEKKGVEFDLKIFIALTRYLDSISELVDTCEIILIEKQLKCNPMAQRLEQHCVSWATFTYLDSKEVIVFNASNKTRVLGAPRMNNGKKMDKRGRKLWAVEVGDHILQLREDLTTSFFIFHEHRSKRDDLCDVILMMNAFKIKRFIDNKVS